MYMNAVEKKQDVPRCEMHSQGKMTRSYQYARARMRIGGQGAWLYLKGLIHSEDSHLMPLTAKETDAENLVDATLIFIGMVLL